ncbi:hypothetical protein HMPREF9156_00857 [Scardovia wiggsiae F0424]|uniref:Uncharacterized protein n=1 Tax=Scardovia wiggsiae F0424 TaxID=857290 RepID=J0LMF5_9BIFI|nr:hypothetical protein [Scardovia wiggsiae]EJD64982.1 hypothetical protein HMPREF9156_00857 [Scardovia wiggsiae F0424]
MAANTSQGSPFDGPSSSRPSPDGPLSGAETPGVPRQKPNARKSIGRTHSIASAVMLCMVILRYLTPGRGPFSIYTAAAACFIVIVYAYFYPFGRVSPTVLVPRIAAIWEACAGLCMAIIAADIKTWLTGIGTATAVMVVGAFLVELLRRERRHLIASLSSTLAAGAMGLFAAGWGVFPSPRGLGGIFSAHPAFAWAVTAVVALSVIILMGVSALWVKNEIEAGSGESIRDTAGGNANGNLRNNNDLHDHDNGPDNSAAYSYADRYTWSGIAMIPVMAAGIFPLLISAAQVLFLK